MTDQSRQGRSSDQPIPPVNVIDSIPDRSPHRPIWKYVLLGVIFLAWVGFLIYCYLAGNVLNPTRLH